MYPLIIGYQLRRKFLVIICLALCSLNLWADIGVDPSGNLHIYSAKPVVDFELLFSLRRLDQEGRLRPNACAPLITFSVAVLIDEAINKHYPSYDAPAPKPKPIWNPEPLNLSYSLDQLNQLFRSNLRNQFTTGRTNPTWTFDNGRGWGHVGVVGQEYFDRLDRFLDQPYTEYDLIRMCPDLSKAFEQQTGFNPRLLDTEDYPGFFEQRFCDVNHSYYYQNKFAQTHPKLLMHKLRYYQIDAFCYYLVRRPEFEKFVLKLEPEIVNHGALKTILRNSLPSSEYNKINTNLQDMLKYIKKQVAEREAAARQKVQRDNLLSRGFNPAGMQLVKNYQHEFEYPCNPTQTNLTREITNHYNQLADFLVNKSYDQQIKEFGYTSETFARGANRANSQQLTTVAGQLLQVAQDLLSLGKGLAYGVGRNFEALYRWDQHAAGLCYLIGTIGVNLAKLGTSIVKIHVASNHLDQEWAHVMLEKESDKYVAKFNQGKMLYSAFKQYCKDAPSEQLLEHTGGFIVDGIVLYLGGPAAAGSKVLQVAGLAGYQATALSKLGDVGRQIQRVVGLAAKAGVGKVEQGLQIIKDHPQIVKAGQAVAQAIQIGREALRQTNRYLKETSRAVAGKVQKIQVGEQIKKIPRACVAKIKQVVDDEAIVVDTWGNTWRSPVNSNHWDVQLSEMGKKNLMLVNEAAAKRGTIIVNELESGLGLSAEAEKIAEKLIKIEMCDQSKSIITSIGLELNQCLAKMRARGVTYRDFYGDHISPELYDRLIDLENFEHLYIPQITPRMTASGVGSKLTGMHWDKNGGLEELGLVKLKNLKQLVGGMHEADMTVNGVLKKGKTLFPSDWDLDTLLAKISEACRNARSANIDTVANKIEIIGTLPEGFEVVVKLKLDGSVLTIYPRPIGG